MSLSRSLTALLALPAAVLAVSLSDFTPRVSNLQSGCNAVYTESISGCQPSDFENQCSKSCVYALVGMTTQVKFACSNQGITGSSLIAQFLDGNGPEALCPDAVLYLGSGSSSAASQAAPASTASPSSAAPASTSASAPSSTAALSSVTSSAPSTSSITAVSSTISSSSSGVVHQTSKSTTTESSSSQSSSPSNQGDSGGGSPFDISGNSPTGGAMSLTVSIATSLFTTSLALSFILR